MMDTNYRIYHAPFNYASLLVVAAAGVIAVAAGMWLASGVAIDPTAIAILFGLTALGVPIFWIASRSESEGDALFQVLLLAWMARLAGLAFKLYIFYVVAGGHADAAAYHREGESIAQLLIAGRLPDLTRFWGTSFVSLLTGFLYVVTGPTLIGGWIIFTFLAMLGMLMHYKAFVAAIPQGNRRLFIVLIFFMPTILMWTNTVGKDALIAFFLGMVTYGVAGLYRRGVGLGGIVLILVGLAGVTLVRPHMGAIVVASLTAAAFLLPVRAGVLSPLIRVAMLVAVVALAITVVRTSASFINLEDISVEGVTSFAQEQGGENTQQGTLAFSGGGFPTTPSAAGRAILTVLLRPFPWETSNLLILASSLEEVGLLGLLLYRIGSVWRAILGARRHPYLAFAAVFIVLFVTFFSTISNFGILIRQRAQVLPFVFIWLAYQHIPAKAEQTASS